MLSMNYEVLAMYEGYLIRRSDYFHQSVSEAACVLISELWVRDVGNDHIANKEIESFSSELMYRQNLLQLLCIDNKITTEQLEKVFLVFNPNAQLPERTSIEQNRKGIKS